VNNDIQRMGLTWEEVEASAQDRQTWRQRVALCIGDAGWIESKSIYYCIYWAFIGSLPQVLSRTEIRSWTQAGPTMLLILINWLNARVKAGSGHSRVLTVIGKLFIMLCNDFQK